MKLESQLAGVSGEVVHVLLKSEATDLHCASVEPMVTPPYTISSYSTARVARIIISDTLFILINKLYLF